MRKLYKYVIDYYYAINFTRFLIITVFTGIFVYLNYQYKIDLQIRTLPTVWLKTAWYSLLFFILFAGTYVIVLIKNKEFKKDYFFYLLLVTAPVIFALKMSFTGISNQYSHVLAFPEGRFWNLTLHWPVKGFFIFLLLCFLWKAGGYKPPVLGLKWKGTDWKWYFKIFLYMLPFLLLASLTPDFEKTYPRLKAVYFIEEISQAPELLYLFYELCYGSDFFTIEIFFRGFLVMAFIRYAGINSILPMAVFYCAIHFGKPLAECISSYFGGILLGIIIYRQQSVWGGFFIHLGIAWSMELLSYINPGGLLSG